jgi:spore germination protein GerM
VPPSATTAPTSVLPTAAPATPPVSAGTERMTLYFADATGTLFVPVERNVRVENGQVAAAAIRALIAGPQNNLQRLVPSNTQLLDVSRTNNIAVVNFDRRPSITDDHGLQSIVQTLVQLPDISLVQFQVNGQNIGMNGNGPDGWMPLNLLNPQNLPVDVHQATFLPLYFPSASGDYDVRIIRLVPPTKQTASATLNALLEGPGSYSGLVRQVIPAGTHMQGVALNDGIISVNLSQQFAGASDHAAAVRTIVESLTTLPTVQGVQFFVEGQSLGEVWEPKYGGIFNKPAINAE